ncbi:MAG: DUF839 domain-containing protein [Bacteroidia bacterium]|nr:DUF839 domain-containing protein [Bacteroidia bacterium]
MNDHISRRNFLKLAGMVGIGFAGLQMVGCRMEGGVSQVRAHRQRKYGALIPDTMGILDLPRGFSYRIISEQKTPMADGFFVPGKPDGMAAFEGPEGKTILIRNHEVSPEMRELGPFGTDRKLLKQLGREKIYDYGQGELPGLGGTTTVIYDTRTQKVELEYLSLAGTIRNCAGGPTPWNSWLTCEETVVRAGYRLEKDHGYVFEVPVSAIPQLADPLPIKAMGRFQHEAVGVDPQTSIVYQTEDRLDGLIYRYIPFVPEKLHAGGKLQALMIKGEPGKDTRNWKEITTPPFPRNTPLAVEWIDLDNIEAPDDDLRLRGFEKGAARFGRGEGMWFGVEECYFACTFGGQNKQGQIFRYRPGPYEGTMRESEAPGTLELFSEPDNSHLLQNCDNMTISPWGDLIVCEDTLEARIMGITPDGGYYPLAKNAKMNSEFSGVTFSPDGTTLFVNIQHQGLTFAITGPWDKTRA